MLVPGLGAHPENSWKHEGKATGFNWTTEGLMKDYPNARMLLFMYESAWTGDIKVDQNMGNIANQLLKALKSLRKVCKTDRKREIHVLTLAFRIKKDQWFL